MAVVKVNRNAVSVKDLLPEQLTGEKLAGEIVLMLSVTMLCNLLFCCRRGKAWPIRK